MKKDLKSFYKQTIVPALIKDFNYKNIEQVPKITAISINRGFGEAAKNSKELDISLKELAIVTGQQPVINKARKSVAGFKIRDGMPIGLSVTLRNERMYDFLERLISVAIPRIRDFRGISPKQFDGRGNFSMGVSEQIIFPEIDYEQVDQMLGLNITIVTTAKNSKEGLALLNKIGIPFSK